MKSQGDLRKMLKEILDDESDRLTTWEVEFIDSVNKQQSITPSQAAVIERIWAKIFG